jgi:hypothetical protein
MQNARDVLTPDSLAMLQVIADTGSFAAAARQLGLVPSALTYRVRQIEDALDVLLFDRSSARRAHRGRRRAAARGRPAAAGHRRRGQPRAPRGHRLGAAADRRRRRRDRVPHTCWSWPAPSYAWRPPTRLQTARRHLRHAGGADLGHADLAWA